MIHRRRGPRTQPRNPYRLTREQHVIPVATLKRFAFLDGRVEVHLRDGRVVKLPVDNQLFCVERLWDQRAESGYMKTIEDRFQALVDMLAAGRCGPLSPEEEKCILRFWSLWHWRSHFIDAPLDDQQLNGIHGEKLTLDQQEILESKGASFALGDGKIPARMFTGLRIQTLIDRDEAIHGYKHWGILRTSAPQLLIGDRPGRMMSVSASPQLLLAADNPDGELTELEASRANAVSVALSRNFVVVAPRQ